MDRNLPLEEQLALHIDHVDPESSQQDILYELLLKSGFSLTEPIEATQIGGKTVFSVADDMLLICLERELTKECIKGMAELMPSVVICLDEGFQGNDQLKTNTVQIMKSRNVNFRTV